MFIIEEVRTELHNNVCEVLFTKADGTERYMRCTTDARIVPESENVVQVPAVEDEVKSHALSATNVRVFDLDINEWRSFNIERLIAISDVHLAGGE